MVFWTNRKITVLQDIVFGMNCEIKMPIKFCGLLWLEVMTPK